MLVGSWRLDAAIESSVVLAGITSCDDFDREIIESGSMMTRSLGGAETIPDHPRRGLIEEGAKPVRTRADTRAQLFDDLPNTLHLLAKVCRFLVDASTPRDDSWAEIIGLATSLQANTECIGECRIGGVPPICEALRSASLASRLGS